MSLTDELMKLNVVQVAAFDPSVLKFSGEFRKLCEQNKCGHYGKNWMCPPAVGPYEELKTKTNRYEEGLVFQTVHQLSPLSGPKELRKSFRAHDEVLKSIVSYLGEKFGVKDVLALGGGPCSYCEECSAVKGESCAYPGYAVASLESYGIDVGALVTGCGMSYKFEKNRATLVGAVFYNLPS